MFEPEISIVPSAIVTSDNEISEERFDEGKRKLHVEAGEFDPSYLEAVRGDFDDQEAVYIMSKELENS